MLHMLARLTDYVDVRMGHASQFVTYIDRSPKSSYDIEHILPDDYQSYASMFNDEEDFNNNRRKFGNLILLTSDHNRSYQDMNYAQKVVQYLSDNILAQSLNSGAYQNNPKFLALVGEFGFQSYSQFDKNAIRDRLQLYTKMAKAIWNQEVIKTLAGGWDEATAVNIQKVDGLRYTVEYGDGRSWEDARKFGFVSASSGTNNLLTNLNVGDYVFCHIAGIGFVGVGICTSQAKPASEFCVSANGIQTPILSCKWEDIDAKNNLPDNELFIGIQWYHTIPLEDGYWEKGMKSVPMVAYTLTDSTTHDKVLSHFGIILS